MAELILLDETPSTNDAAKELARSGAAHGTAVLAARQSAGRGRMSHSFCSPEGGLYLSVVLRPNLPPELLPLCTPLAAVAVCRALAKEAGVECRIKWVNDLLLQGKKLCGILCEGVSGAVICGIGVNLREPFNGFPSEVRDLIAVLPAAVDRIVLARAILRELLDLCAVLPDTEFLNEYRERSAVLGRTVTVRDPAGNFDARALAIDDLGGLVLSLPGGRLRTLRAGEISIKLKE
ncbi:MAG: biotin--[acetyl-CoA-carboxylase] ligase [Clostridiaceae bacterium]|nr:biotin--[acetyl-CoA-carboxylase] ligase [Clostridiaceae bacterium]